MQHKASELTSTSCQERGGGGGDGDNEETRGRSACTGKQYQHQQEVVDVSCLYYSWRRGPTPLLS